MDRSRASKSDFLRLGILAALCLALGIYLIATAVLISKDGVFYIHEAQNLAHDPLSVAQKHQPGYPILLWLAHRVALVFAGSDSLSLWVHTSQAATLLCRTLALIPLYFLARSLVGGVKAFWAVLILIALPYPAQVGSDALRDWPYVMFVCFGFWLMNLALRRRIWWLFVLVGLSAAMGYVIQPAAAQVVLYGLLGLGVVLREGATQERSPRRGPLIAGVLLLAGVAVPVLPYMGATGTPLPPQLQRSAFNSAPQITSVGGRGASGDPLEFEVGEGQRLEVGIDAFDAQGSRLTFSVVAVPAGARPVHQFRLTDSGDGFMTTSDDERNLLLDSCPPASRTYEGIVGYAYAQADGQGGLEAVHRFWSPVRRRHFYTINPSEKDALLAEPPADQWQYEGIVFYAFPPGRRPPDAVPVHRFRSEQSEYSWAARTSSGTIAGDVDEGVAWYFHSAGRPPEGLVMEGGTLRWRPGPDQRGVHWLNVVVSDGDMESCQLVKVAVREGPVVAASAERGHVNAGAAPVQRVGLSRLPEAAHAVFDGFAESLLVVFLIPWGVGLYHRLRHDADRLERVLTITVIAANAGLVVGRYLWVSPTMERRYCLACVALTIFYVPVGLERIALWLSRSRLYRSRQRELLDRRVSAWFHILAIVGIGICLPKALTPLYAEKASYLQAVQWLRDKTQAADVIAAEDSRLAFYAERPGLVYRTEMDPRRADYIVRIADPDAAAAPSGWSLEYSTPVHDRRNRTLMIYKTHRRKS